MNCLHQKKDHHRQKNTHYPLYHFHTSTLLYIFLQFCYPILHRGKSIWKSQYRKSLLQFPILNQLPQLLSSLFCLSSWYTGITHFTHYSKRNEIIKGSDQQPKAKLSSVKSRILNLISPIRKAVILIMHKPVGMS